MNSKITANSQLLTTTDKTKTRANQANNQNRKRTTEIEQSDIQSKLQFYKIIVLWTFFFFKLYLLIMLLQLSHFPPFTPLRPALPLPPTLPPYSSCPWVILISSLASTFPTLFLPSPCLFSTYYLCYLFSVPSPPSPSHVPIDNPPCDLNLCGSVPVLVICLVCSCFCFRCGC